MGGVSDQFKKSKKILKEKPSFGDELPLVRPPQKQPIGAGGKFSQNSGLPVLEKKGTATLAKESRNTSRQRSKGPLTPQNQMRGSTDGKAIFQSAKTEDIREQQFDLNSGDVSTNPTADVPSNNSTKAKPNLKFGPSKGWSKRDPISTPQAEYGDEDSQGPSRAQGPGKSLPRLVGRSTAASSSAALGSQKRDASRTEAKGRVGPPGQGAASGAKVALSGLRGKEAVLEDGDKKKHKPKAQAAIEKLSNMVLHGLCAKSQAGFSEGKTKTNQDAIFYNINLKASPNCGLFGVFDGHGLQGHKVSSFIKENLRSILFLIQIVLIRDSTHSETIHSKIIRKYWKLHF